MTEEEQNLDNADEVTPLTSHVVIQDAAPLLESTTLPEVEPSLQDLPIPEDNPTQKGLETPPDKPLTAASLSSTPPDDSDIRQQLATNEHDLLHEQFDNYLRIANALMGTLKRPKDVEVCSDLLARAQKLNANPLLEVKRNNNRFFRYCLRVIKYTSENQPLDYYRKMFNLYEEKDNNDEKAIERRTWLKENTSYMAMKTLKDGTVIFYVAVANDPSAGWQEGGLAVLEKKAACGRV